MEVLNFSKEAKTRVASLDLLKGLVMVVMALDHTRDFFHAFTFNYNIEDPEVSSLPIFLTRWITHFCAPTFCFLAGTSAFLMGARKSKKELSGFLVKRGLWLVLMEITVINFAWSFQIDFSQVFLATIWSLGFSMMALSLLVFLPYRLLLAISLLLVFGHNFLDTNHFNNHFLWKMLHDGGAVMFGNVQIFFAYPVLPWIAVMALGYCFGKLYERNFDTAKRKQILTWLGLGAIALFFVLRAINTFGNPEPWTAYPTLSQTLISYLNPEKYPPSLIYLLMTLGPALLFLSASEKLKGSLVNFFSTFGRVPFFYYILHLYFIHLPALAVGFFMPPGFRLWVVYVVWMAVVLALYPFCKWFDRYKMAHKEKWWLSYL